MTSNFDLELLPHYCLILSRNKQNIMKDDMKCFHFTLSSKLKLNFISCEKTRRGPKSTASLSMPDYEIHF